MRYSEFVVGVGVEGDAGLVEDGVDEEELDGLQVVSTVQPEQGRLHLRMFLRPQSQSQADTQSNSHYQQKANQCKEPCARHAAYSLLSRRLFRSLVGQRLGRRICHLLLAFALPY